MLRRALVRRHKLAARIALYLVPVALVAAGWWMTRWAKTVLPHFGDWQDVDFLEHEPVRLLAEYLRIDTSVAGSEVAGAEFLARQLEAAGVEAHVERVGERHANLWAVVEGDDPGAVVLHNHIDVAAVAEPEKWKVPPFSATIDGPWIIGPGAFDMKSVAIAQLVAFLEVAERPTRPARSLVFLATGDEETGSRFGTRRVLEGQPELVARFDVVLTEGGVVEARGIDDVKYWGTEIAQKRFVDLEVRAAEREPLVALAERLAAHDRELRARPTLVPAVERFFAAYAPSRDSTIYQEQLRGVRQALAEGREPVDAPFAAALLTQGLGLGEVETDPRGGHVLSVRVELLPGVDVDEVLPPELLAGFTVVRHDEAPRIADDARLASHPVFTTIGEVVEARHQAPHGPMIVPWSITDARFFRGAGIPTFGFSPFVIVSSDTLMLEGPGERIALPAFLEGVELYAELVARLVARPGER